MATALKSSDSDLKAFIEEVRRGANAQYESPQYKKLLALPLTQKRAQVYTLQKTLWTFNRRDCWAFAQALSPMDVKKLVWAHEEDELSGNKERNMGDHFTLQVKSAELIGLTADDFRNEVPRPETRTCLYAWVHLVKDSPWLKSIAACIALEVDNSAEWVNGGGMSYRMGKRFEQDLGVPFEKNINAKEHSEVDIEHAHMLLQVVRRHGTTKAAMDLVREGLEESWAIERVWKGLLHDMMAEHPGPR
jgi:pyrroloquinoline quinone (PQQ) biosynthesis protein C